ncbi:hypothetical protein [Mucilaginibacter sp.]|uniref:hypothetical protein n=1 Tax=Mucilaginibacter sp. TaxID=1882438 RepID=UPI003D12A215
MGAVIINMREYGQTPQQVISAFFSAYTPLAVQESLWKFFREYTLGNACVTDQSLEGMAILFDGLIDLVTVIDALNQVESMVNCPYCGKPAGADPG